MPGGARYETAPAFRHNRATARLPAPARPFAETARTAIQPLDSTSPPLVSWHCLFLICPLIAASCNGRVGARSFLDVFGRVQTHFAKFGDQIPSPAIDVVFANRLTHPMYAHLLVFRFHL